MFNPTSGLEITDPSADRWAGSRLAEAYPCGIESPRRIRDITVGYHLRANQMIGIHEGEDLHGPPELSTE